MKLSDMTLKQMVEHVNSTCQMDAGEEQMRAAAEWFAAAWTRARDRGENAFELLSQEQCFVLLLLAYPRDNVRGATEPFEYIYSRLTDAQQLWYLRQVVRVAAVDFEEFVDCFNHEAVAVYRDDIIDRLLDEGMHECVTSEMLFGIMRRCACEMSNEQILKLALNIAQTCVDDEDGGAGSTVL